MTTTLRCAIYCRKSTSQHDVEDDARSVVRQEANARAFARAKGWVVLDAHVYCDDGISGASTRLPAKRRMLTALENGSGDPLFDCIVMQAPDRFSRRDGDESFAELKAIAKRGVQVWFYSDGSRFQFGDFASNTLGFLKGEFAAEYRRAISQKTMEGHLRKARLGHVIGGRRFGYRNVTVDRHGDLVIDEAEAVVVRRIFELFGNGVGYTRLAKQLNRENAVCPRGSHGWAPSTIRSLLFNEVYRGELVAFRTKKRDASGDRRQTRRPPSEHVRFERPDLRIVTDEQWHMAHARLKPGSFPGKRVVRRDYDSKNLLVGFARCATCNGSLAVVSRSHGHSRKYFYGCLANAKRGPTACPNGLVKSLQTVDDAVLKALGGDVLRPVVVSAIISAYLDALLPPNVDARVAELRKRLRIIDGKLAHLTEAIELGGPLTALVAQVAERQAERDELRDELARAETYQHIAIDRAAIEAEVQAEVANWRGLLTGSVEDGRQLLREALEAPFRFERDGDVYKFSAPVATGRLVAGAIGLRGPHCVASPTG